MYTFFQSLTANFGPFKFSISKARHANHLQRLVWVSEPEVTRQSLLERSAGKAQGGFVGFPPQLGCSAAAAAASCANSAPLLLFDQTSSSELSNTNQNHSSLESLSLIPRFQWKKIEFFGLGDVWAEVTRINHYCCCCHCFWFLLFSLSNMEICHCHRHRL